MMLPIQIALALQKLGMLSPEQMRECAEELLLAGKDSPTLRILAGLNKDELDDAESMFQRVKQESGLPTPSPREAAIQVTRWLASLICGGELEPYAGARKIWHLAQAVNEEAFHDLDPFIYAASEYQERPSDRPHFAAEIVNEARRWCDR